MTTTIQQRFCNSFGNIPTSPTSNLLTTTTTLEKSQATTLELIGGLWKTVIGNNSSGNTMVSVSGLFSLNLLSKMLLTHPTRRIEKLLILGNTLYLEEFWVEMSEIILTSANHITCRTKTRELLQKRENIFNTISYFNSLSYYCLKKFNKEIKNSWSWLASEEQFRPVQELFKRGGFAFKQLNLSHIRGVQEISEILHKQNCRVNLLYISHAWEDLATSSDKESFIRSIASLIHDKTFIVHSQKRSTNGEPLRQVVSQPGPYPALIESLFDPHFPGRPFHIHDQNSWCDLDSPRTTAQKITSLEACISLGPSIVVARSVRTLSHTKNSSSASYEIPPSLLEKIETDRESRSDLGIEILIQIPLSKEADLSEDPLQHKFAPEIESSIYYPEEFQIELPEIAETVSASPIQNRAARIKRPSIYAKRAPHVHTITSLYSYTLYYPTTLVIPPLLSYRWQLYPYQVAPFSR